MFIELAEICLKVCVCVCMHVTGVWVTEGKKISS